MVTITIARNEKNYGIYEAHKAGCAHLNLRHMDVMLTAEVEDAEAYTKDYAETQDGILSTLGPCLKRGKREVYGDLDY